MHYEYDPRTAITFLLAGIGIGALLALILNPRYASFPLAQGRTRERRQEPHLSRAV